MIDSTFAARLADLRPPESVVEAVEALARAAVDLLVLAASDPAGAVALAQLLREAAAVRCEAIEEAARRGGG